MAVWLTMSLMNYCICLITEGKVLQEHWSHWYAKLNITCLRLSV